MSLAFRFTIPPEILIFIYQSDIVISPPPPRNCVWNKNVYGANETKLIKISQNCKSTTNRRWRANWMLLTGGHIVIM